VNLSARDVIKHRTGGLEGPLCGVLRWLCIKVWPCRRVHRPDAHILNHPQVQFCQNYDINFIKKKLKKEEKEGGNLLFEICDLTELWESVLGGEGLVLR